MAKISDSAIATAAFNAGIPREKVSTAVAIALAESGGDTHAHNPVPPDNSYGLWQINMLGSMGPERRKQFNITANEQLFDTNINARAMAIISNKGANWTPWTTYTRGTFLQYMARGNAARDTLGTTPAPTIPPTLTPVLSPPSIATIIAFVKLLTNKKNWIRFGLFSVGFILTGIALVKITGTSIIPGGKKAVQLATEIIPMGKAAKAIKAVKK